jgi:glycosyltransferase involved in cell wall biosynthesis
LAASLGVGGRVTFTGGLYDDGKWGAFAAAGLFVACSHAECFGVSLAAAMAAGVPVAVSNKVNTWREIVADGAGFVADDTVEGTLHLLEQWLASDSCRVTTMRENARRCFAARYSPRCMAAALVHTLEHYGVVNSLLTENASQ